MSRHAYQMPFSPGGEFVWNRRVPHEGVTTEIGQPVDKSKFTPVRLRQMYEGRMIVPAEALVPAPAYLENGRGLAAKLEAERLAREAAEARAASAEKRAERAETIMRAGAPDQEIGIRTAPAAKKGQGDAQPRSAAEPAAPRGARAAKPAHVVGKKPAERLGSKPAAKSAPKRAAARSR